MTRYDFYIHTYEDNPLRIIRELEQFHPESRVILISDGGMKNYDHPLFHKFDERLKHKSHKWIIRWFDLIREYGSNIAVKVDPDSVCFREFRIPFPDALFFGSINSEYHKGKLWRYIHGGAQFITKEFIDLIYDQLQNGDFSGEQFRYKGGKMISADKILCFLAEKNNIPLVNYLDVGSGPNGFSGRQALSNHGYAIIHSRKMTR